MGIAERRVRQKMELREAILDAARRIVLDEGYESLSMRKIASMIEYSPASIYLHFESRDDIARELVRQGFDLFLRYFSTAAAIVDPWDRLDEIGRLYIKFAMEQPEAYRLIFMTKFSDALEMPHAEGPDANTPGNGGEQVLGMLHAIVEELVAAGRMEPTDPAMVAELCWASMHGLVSLHLTCENMALSDLQTSADKMSRIMRVGLETRP